MGHVHKRLASTAAKVASVATSHLKSFPPPEALSNSKFFSPETWAAVQPPPPSALVALVHRIGLGNILTSTEAIQQACTHPSFLPLYARQYPEGLQPVTNGNLAAFGNSLMGLFAAEYLNASFPYLPTRVLKAAVSAYVGPPTCAGVAREIGATPLLRWQRTPATPTRRAILHSDALASIPRSITALVYQQGSVPHARKFVHDFFLSRDVDFRAMIKFRDPKKALIHTVAKFGRHSPISRLLAETGRFSNSPVYVVGIYSGSDQLGEGFGSSLKMAEYRAAENALHRLYLTREPPERLRLPTSTFEATSPTELFRPSPLQLNADGVLDSGYVPGDMGPAEDTYASSDKSHVIASPNKYERESSSTPEEKYQGS